MASVPSKIMRRVRGYGRGQRVFTPKDFLDLGSRPAVDQALSRLAKSGDLRRVARGLYDMPRVNPLLGRPASASLDHVLEAIARRDAIKIISDDIVAAYNFGLTTAVPAQPSYLTDGRSRQLKIGNRVVRLQHANPNLVSKSNQKHVTIIRAVQWLGPDASQDPDVVKKINGLLTSEDKEKLQKDKRLIPSSLASFFESNLADTRIRA